MPNMAAPIVRARLSRTLFATLKCRRLSAQAAVKLDTEADGTKRNLPVPYRTNVDSPSKHQSHHVGKFYTVPKSLETGLFGIFKPSKGSRQLAKFVGEMAVMVREPFLEVRDYIESYDYSQPALRIMLYGRWGTGKNHTMSHVLHYAFENDWLLVTNAWIAEWTKRPKEVQANEKDPKILESPMEAAVWLQQFKAMNAHLLDKLQLATTSTTKFSDTESVAAGEPLLNLVAHGLARIKHSNECVRSLLREIKSQTDSGTLKTMVIVGGVNSIWELSYQQDADRNFIPAENFHLLQSFKDIMNNDWRNAAIVVSVTESSLSLKHRKLRVDNVPSFMPQYLLGSRGFEFFEPFLPVCVEKYSAKEIESAIDYLIDTNFIQHPKAKTPAAREELKFLSGHNPRMLRSICQWI